MSAPARVVVVGASVGGLAAAEALREEGFAGEILVIGEERHAPYLRPPLSKQVLLGQWPVDRTTMPAVARCDELGLRLRMDCGATSLDVARRVLGTSDGEVPFDELIIATGCAPRRHPLLPDALGLRTLDDAVVLRDALASAERIGIVGAGVLGSEVASAARARGVDALLVGRGSAIGFGAVGTLLGDRLARLHRAHGVELALGTAVAAVDRHGATTRLTLADGREETVDLVAVMIGAIPRTEWLESSGLALQDGVLCDSEGRAAPGVSAVGDVAAWRNPSTGDPVRVEHQSNAIEQGIAVAIRITTGAPVAQPVPFFWSELHGTRIQAYGWFDPGLPLVPLAGTSGDDGAVLASDDPTGRLRGVVGWNAAPRDFRAARAAVASASVPGSAPVPEPVSV